MKTKYHLLMGGTAFLVSLFLNFRYAYGGYGASAQFSSGPSLLAIEPGKDPGKDSDTDTDNTCGTAENGEKYECDSKTEFEHSVGTCIYYVAKYKCSKDKQFDMEHEGEIIRGKKVKVLEDNEYDDWEVAYTLSNADITKVYPEYLPLNVCYNKDEDMPEIIREVKAGTKTDVKCLEGGSDRCLPEEGKPTCAGESNSNFGY